MGFLERAIKKGISEGIGKAVGNAISQAIEPKAAEIANRAADHLDKRTENSDIKTQSFSNMESAFSNFERAAQNFATKQAENLKICPSCGEPAAKEQKFCPSCGGALPEQTVAQSAVCTSCGKQNNIGTKFCTDCGAKLPQAIMEEENQARKNAEVIEQWSERLPQYPVWSFGGEDYYIDDYDAYTVFGASFKDNYSLARNALAQYGELLRQNGFRPAGQYPSDVQLYKMIDGVCYHVDLEHCFDGGCDNMQVCFATGEPTGGFNYVKPEPKKPLGLKDIFNF